MNARHIVIALAMLHLYAVFNSSQAATFEPDKLVFVSDDSERDFLSDLMDPGPLDDMGNIVVRERRTLTQDNLQIRTFVEFDLDSLTADAVANPGFSATFSVDYVTRLNTVNAMGVLVGRVLDDGVNGDAWDVFEPDLPLFEWGRLEGETEPVAADSVVIIDNIQTDSLGTYRADVTPIVRDWVSGTHANHGFVLFGDLDEFQGAGLDNAQLVTGLLGDFDGNGAIEVADFNILSDHLAAHLDGPVTSEDGDIDIDGDVDLDDFGLFKEIFPDVVAQAQGVPEPTSLMLVATAMLGLLMMRQRCQDGRRPLK